MADKSDLKHVKPTEPIRADDANNVRDALRALLGSNLQGGAYLPSLGFISGKNDAHPRIGTFWATIDREDSGGGGEYDQWTEVVPDGAGGWAAGGALRDETNTGLSIFADNGAEGITADGSVVVLVTSVLSEDGLRFVFVAGSAKSSSLAGGGGCYAKCLEGVVTKAAGNSDTVTIDAADFRGRWVHGMVVACSNRNHSVNQDWEQVDCNDDTEYALDSDAICGVTATLCIDGTDGGKLKMTFSAAPATSRTFNYFVRATEQRCPCPDCDATCEDDGTACTHCDDITPSQFTVTFADIELCSCYDEGLGVWSKLEWVSGDQINASHVLDQVGGTPCEWDYTDTGSTLRYSQFASEADCLANNSPTSTELADYSIRLTREAGQWVLEVQVGNIGGLTLSLFYATEDSVECGTGVESCACVPDFADENVACGEMHRSTSAGTATVECGGGV